MIETSKTPSPSPQLGAAVAGKKPRRILALAVFALGLNATAFVYSMSPADFALPNVSQVLAELLPHGAASAPIPATVIAALTDIQSAQQRSSAALQDIGFLLQQNTALLQQDTIKLDALRSTLTDEQSDVKTMSSQISTLIAKVDSLQSAVTSAAEITSSVLKVRAQSRPFQAVHKRLARVVNLRDISHLVLPL